MTVIRVALALLLWLGALVGAVALLAEVSEEPLASFSAQELQVAALPATLVTCVDPRAPAPTLAPPAWMDGRDRGVR